MDSINKFVNHKGLLTTHLNARSIWNKIDLIRNTFINKNVDIITFSETWLTSKMPNEMIDIEGYTIVRNDRNWHEDQITQITKKGGGVYLYSRWLRFQSEYHN